jgi:hypothetical protein
MRNGEKLNNIKCNLTKLYVCTIIKKMDHERTLYSQLFLFDNQNFFFNKFVDLGSINRSKTFKKNLTEYLRKKPNDLSFKNLTKERIEELKKEIGIVLVDLNINEMKFKNKIKIINNNNIVKKNNFL